MAPSKQHESGGAARPDPRDTRLVLITAPDPETAESLARAWVERGLAACVNVIPGLVSVYRWKGAVESARECLMVVKTTAARIVDIERALATEHPYELPECVVLAPEHVEARYAAWLAASVEAQ